MHTVYASVCSVSQMSVYMHIGISLPAMPVCLCASQHYKIVSNKNFDVKKLYFWRPIRQTIVA